MKRKKSKLTLHQLLSNMGLYEGEYEEKWIFIDGEKSIYKIRNNGEVISTEYMGHPRPIPLSMSGGLDADGYHIISLTHNKKKHTFKVHRLVGIYFIDNPENKPEINHKNCNKLDNRISNLEWSTSDENTLHAKMKGLRQSTVDPEMVEYVCVLLSTNAYSISEISIMSGVSKPNIIKIKNKVTWKSISDKYPIENYVSDDHKDYSNSGKRLSENTVLQIASDLVNNNGSLSEIAQRYDTSIQTIRRIYMRENHSELTQDFDFSKYIIKTNQFC